MCLSQSRELSEGWHCQGYEKLMIVAYDTLKMIFMDLRIDSPTYKSVDVIDVKPGRVVLFLME